MGHLIYLSGRRRRAPISTSIIKATTSCKTKAYGDAGKNDFAHVVALEPRVVNWNLVTKGETNDEKRLNATYIISVARKLGCSIFLLPEDIMQVNQKMILSFTNMLILHDKKEYRING
ncbi:unnamed protein product [Fraxinus pennsylvanica]|uniref:Calponin-homology (CH) domain-containing protein n=1 Tax=Fraxinus pennsylvanica TaxID=56036 RepID=A0AAD1YT62_9LAMI|nr:unnamed protein product [Fraxinus pennsylvanica]